MADLNNLSISALALLRLVAHLAPAPLSIELFDGPTGPRNFADATASVARERPTSGSSSLATVGDALAELTRQGLAQLEGRTFRLTEGIHDLAISAIPEGERRAWVERALNLLNDFAPDDADDPRTWSTWTWLAPHAARVIALAEGQRIPHPTGILMGEKLGVFWFLNGRVAEAEKLLRRAIELDEAHFGPDHPTLAVDLNNLAVLLGSTGRQTEATPLRMRVMRILVEHRADEPAKYATALHNLAGMLADQGRVAESEEMHRTALAADEAHFGRDHQTVARDLRGLAFLLSGTGRKSEAAEALRRALDADEKALGPNHPSVAFDLKALAATEASGGRPGIAPLLARALAIDEAWIPPDDATILQDLLNLAAIHTRDDAFDEALSCYERIVERYQGGPVQDVEPLLNTCRALADGAPPAAPAQDWSRLALRAFRSAANKLGWATPAMRALASQVAAALSRAGLQQDSRSLELESTERYLRKAAETRPSAQTWNALGLFLKNERADYDGAEECYRKTLALAPDDANYNGNFALFLTSVRRRHDEAENLYLRAIELGPREANTLANYAFFLQNVRKNLEEAEKLYRMALELAPRDANVHANFASLLIVSGRLDEADEHIATAWACKNGVHDRISARPIVLKAAIEVLRGHDPAGYLGRLKTLFGRGIAHAPWSAESLLDHLRAKLPADAFGLFAALVEAIGDRNTLDALEGFAAWKDATPVALDAPWKEITEI